MSFLDKIKGAFSKEKKEEPSARLPHFNNSHYSGNAIIYTPGLETNNAKKAEAKPDFVPITEQKQEVAAEPAVSFEEPVAEVAEAAEEPAVSFEEPVAEVAEAAEEPSISFEEPVAEVAEAVEEPAISFEEPVAEVAEAVEEPAIEVKENADSFIYTPEATESEAESFIYTPEETDLSFEPGADFGTVNDDDIPSFEIVSDDEPAISFDENVDLDFSAPTDDE